MSDSESSQPSQPAQSSPTPPVPDPQPRRPDRLVTIGGLLFVVGLALFVVVVVAAVTGMDVPAGTGEVTTVLLGLGVGCGLLAVVGDVRRRRNR